MVRALTPEDREYLRELLADDDEDEGQEDAPEGDEDEGQEDAPEDDEDDVISYKGQEYRRVGAKEAAPKRRAPVAKRQPARPVKKAAAKVPPKKTTVPAVSKDPAPGKRRLFT